MSYKNYTTSIYSKSKYSFEEHFEELLYGYPKENIKMVCLASLCEDYFPVVQPDTLNLITHSNFAKLKTKRWYQFSKTRVKNHLIIQNRSPTGKTSKYATVDSSALDEVFRL